jgi:diacylglycerol kinase family enzyme
VICVGGDGTLNSFLNSGSTFSAVAFFGAGTANVLSIEFGLPRTVEPFLEMLLADHRRKIHPGRLQDGSRFLMMASYGIDGFVMSLVSQKLKNRLGKSAIMWAFLQALVTYRYPRAHLVCDQGPAIETSLAIVSRIQHYAGRYRVTPAADPAATTLEVIALKPGGLWWTAGFFLNLVRGRLRPSRRLLFARANEVTIERPDQRLIFQLDGTRWRSEVRQIRVAAEPIEMIVPAPQS